VTNGNRLAVLAEQTRLKWANRKIENGGISLGLKNVFRE